MLSQTIKISGSQFVIDIVGDIMSVSLATGDIISNMLKQTQYSSYLVG